MRPRLRPTIWLAVLAVLAPITLFAGSSSAAPQPAGPDRVQAAGGPADGSLGPAAAASIEQGYLVANQARYDRAKRAAAAAPPSTEPATLDPAAPPAPLAPVVSRNWQGIRDTQSAPSDSTGAIGTTRYVELVNRRFGIYNRTSNTPLSTGTLASFVGASPAANVFDPQVMWDPQTDRFYYAADQVNNSTENFLAFGFSKTASPNTAADFCQYVLSYGTTLPDYPKLGDTADFILIGSNNFANGSTFVGGFVQWITKPAPGSACPGPETFSTDSVGPLRHANGTMADTPVPANQTDANTTGYILASEFDGASFLTRYTVTTGAGGVASIPITGTAVPVPAYTTPPDAPQPGVAQVLDTLDGRLTQAVSAIDPARGGAVGLWTQHTVQGGAGAQVRWYEINPVAATTFQIGVLTHPTIFVFNSAISPDRAVNGASAQFGSNMVIQVSTSSTATTPAIRLLSKVGAGPLSAPVTIIVSTAAYVGFDCPGGFDFQCRWGDYSAATPDPVATVGATVGRVWITNTYASGIQTTTQANWLTRNAAVAP